MMNAVTINYKGVELKVDGTFHNARPGSHIIPPDPAEFEIDNVYFNHEDVTELLEAMNFDFSEIEELVIEEVLSRYV